MKYGWKNFPAIILLICIIPAKAQTKTGIDVWITNPDKSALFAQQQVALLFGASGNYQLITVDDKQTYQSIDGFGFALTGGSAMHIIKMSAESRAKLLQELFATDGDNIGVSYLRLSIGSSDLNEHIFSYDDLPQGETDVAMEKFDLGRDRLDVIPVLKEILAINPAIKILGSPWSPPAWMKTNNDTRGGRLKPEYYAAYAKYFVKYIQQMKAVGITIDAITVQNEPLHPGNNPSILITAPEEKDFVKNNLGPAFEAAGIHTKILIYDHNADRPDYPVTILDDPKAAKYIDGSAFHLYGGKIEALTDVHNAHPEKNIYFTEQMVVQFHDTAKMNIASPVSRIIIGATRNWCRNVLEWNLAAGPDFKPYTDRGGCSMCQGAVTIDSNSVTKNIAYYSIAHVSKFIRPGSVRIASNYIDSLPNVAFTTPAGKKVLIVVNDSKNPQSFTIRYNGKDAAATLEGKAVGTFVW
ncbi:MAG: glycoside hydrolase family 30 beta sandwich domain-containing protein [Ginsengibacter sp.]